MKIKPVFRYDKSGRILRLFRVMWTKGTVGDGKGYSQKVSLALQPRLFGFHRSYGSTILTLFGVRLHVERSYGGVHV